MNEKISKLLDFLKLKTKQYKTYIIVLVILITGYMYKKYITVKEYIKKENIINASENNEVENNLKKTIMINVNLYNKTEKEKKKYLLSNFDMDNVIFNENAKITIIDYSSFTCKFCKSMRNDINKIIKEYAIQKHLIKYVLRPVYSKKTIPIGALLLCSEPSKRKEIAENFFNIDINQVTDFEKLLIDIGKKYNMNEDYIKQCIYNEENYEKIIYMQNESKDIFDLNATPALIINGTKYTGYKNYKAIENIIQQILNKNDTKN